MRNLTLFTFCLFIISSIIGINKTYGQASGHFVGSDYILMECESTESNLNLWNKISKGEANYVYGASGETHLEFSGNTKNGGSPNSNLNYSFIAPKTGTYRITIRSRKRLDGEEPDKCNDCWIKLSGDFTSGNSVPEDVLRKFTKLYGGAANGWGWASNLDGEEADHIACKYKLKAGQEYTLTIAGRSIRYNMDYILIYDDNAYSLNQAQNQLNFANADDCNKLDSDDFELNIEGFVPGYIDNDRKCVGINTVQQPVDQWAAATSTYKGEAGTMNVVFTSLLESDGECSYKVIIGNDTILDYQNPRIFDTDILEYTPYRIVAKNVEIEENAEIKVEYLSNSNELVPEGDAFGYARARWKSITFGDCETDLADRWYSTDPDDPDGDGISVENDNCPDYYNPGQEDIDGDGKGDACDVPKQKVEGVHVIIKDANSLEASWDDAIDNETGFIIERSVSGENNFEILDTVSAGTTSYIDESVSEFVLYEYRVIVMYEDENSLPSVTGVGRTPSSEDADLPEPWKFKNFGQTMVAMAGNASYGNETFTIHGGDGDFWTESDRGQFIYQPFSGDCQIIAKLTDYTHAQDFTMAGVMIRETLDKGSKFAAMLMISNPGPVLRDRKSTNGSVNQKPYDQTGEKAPYWVKLRRSGNKFTGFISSDGSNWKEIRSVNISMNNDVFVGMAANTHTPEMDGEYGFSNVSIDDISAVEIHGFNNIKVFPNPVNDIINITGMDNIDSIKLISTNGQVLISSKIQSATSAINISSFKKGTYILELINNDGNNKTFSLVKK